MQAEAEYQDDIIVINFSEEQTKQIDEDYLNNTKTFITSTSPYRLDNWYEQLKEFTFETEFFSMTAIQGYALLKIYHKEELNEREQEAVKGLTNRIGEVMDKHFKNSGCFVKLSTRSPKDYSWDFRDPSYFQSSVDSLALFLKSCPWFHVPEEPRPLSLPELNTLYSFLMESSKHRLHIRSSSDFLKLFTSSQRIVIDLEHLSTVDGFLFRRFKEGDYGEAQKELIKVCLRMWKDFKWENEFRCFYYRYRLTGVCQYEQDCVFEKWVAKEGWVGNKVHQYFQSILPALKKTGLDKGVLDIYFTNDLKEISMIEVNPYDQNTRASLFDWKQDEKLLKGEQGNEIIVRIRTEYSSRLNVKLRSIMGMLEKGSQEVVKQALKKAFGDKIYFENE